MFHERTPLTSLSAKEPIPFRRNLQCKTERDQKGLGFNLLFLPLIFRLLGIGIGRMDFLSDSIPIGRGGMKGNVPDTSWSRPLPLPFRVEHKK